MATGVRGTSTSLQTVILHLGELATNPQYKVGDRAASEAKLREVLEKSSTINLMRALTPLVPPGKVPVYLRSYLQHILATLPLRPNGVRSTTEFILSVHPSTAGRQNARDTTITAGFNVSLEALSTVSSLISSPPTHVAPDAWFQAIAPQLFAMLDGHGGLEMVKAASYIIGYGILGRKDYGAPGTAGWNALAEPLLSSINPSLRTSIPVEGSSTLDVIDLVRKRALTSPSNLADALRRLASLLSSHPNPLLSRRLLGNLLLPLWALTSWPAHGKDHEQWRAPSAYLLQIYLELTDAEKLEVILKNLLFNGIMNSNRANWMFETAGEGIQIIKASAARFEHYTSPDALEKKIDAFLAILQKIRDGNGIPALFLSLCKKYLTTTAESAMSKVQISEDPGTTVEGQRQEYIEAKIMQRMIHDMPGKLIDNSTQIMDLANDIMSSYLRTESSDDDDNVTLALSLLNLVFTSSIFRQTQHPEIMSVLRSNLDSIAHRSLSQSSKTAANLLIYLDLQASDPDIVKPEAEQLIADRKTHALALSYLTSATAPPPVRAEGLSLLSTLIIPRTSAILSIPSTLVLLQSLLQDEEEYIYLLAIKTITLLSNQHRNAVLQSLTDAYLDTAEDYSLDVRLRIGEAMVAVIERAGEALAGPSAEAIFAALLSIASRRRVRIKTKAKAEKAARLDAQKATKFEEAWDGVIPVDKEDASAGSDDEPAHPLLQSIVKGWDSAAGRGVEDPRIRASALSILSLAIRTNVAGLPVAQLSDGIDVCVNSLALEFDPSMAIIRRAAILYILDLLKALDDARDAGRYVGFDFAGNETKDVVRILQYVADSDNDGLVRQHAKDVVESLQAWQFKNLLPRGRKHGAHVMGEVAGLNDGIAGLPGLNTRDTGIGKPRIEEID